MRTLDMLYRDYLGYAEEVYLMIKAIREHGPRVQLVRMLDDAIVRADRAWEDYQRAAQDM